MIPIQQTLPLEGAHAISGLQLRALHSLFRLYAARFWNSAGVLPDAGAAASGPEGAGDRGAASTSVSAEPEPAYSCSPAHDFRAERLAWASARIGRALGGFSELTSSEAAALIDALKRALGQKVKRARARRRPDRRQAHAYGTAGRRADASNEIQLIDDDTLNMIDTLIAHLGWIPQQLDSFLRSPMSPVRSGAIRTLAEGNRVIWALKNMIRTRKEKNTARSL